jgi:hypothetical protein
MFPEFSITDIIALPLEVKGVNLTVVDCALPVTSWKRLKHDSVPQLPMESKCVASVHQNVSNEHSCKPQYSL